MLKELRESLDSNEKRYGSKANWTLVVGVTALIFAPTLISQIHTGIDFSKTGQIGDTIGGITTPILTLIGSFLVYYSFRQQLIANRIQLDALMEERTERSDDKIISFCESISNDIRTDINNFSTYDDNLNEHKGNDGFIKIFKTQLVNCLLDKETMNKAYGISIVIKILEEYNLLLTYVNSIKNLKNKEMVMSRYNHRISKIIFNKPCRDYLHQASFKPNYNSEIYSLLKEIDNKINEIDNSFETKI